MWDFNSLTRDQACAHCACALEVWSFNHWTTREVPQTLVDTHVHSHLQNDMVSLIRMYFKWGLPSYCFWRDRRKCLKCIFTTYCKLLGLPSWCSW